MREDGDRYLWILVIMAVLGVGVPTAVRSGAPAPAEPPAETAPGTGRPAGAATPASRAPGMSPDFFGPLQAILGCGSPGPELEDSGRALDQWFGSCRLGGVARSRGALVALVPDPLDSMYEHTFDRLLEAINRAAGQAGYVRDRYYLPWQTDLAARRADKRPGSPPSTDDHEGTPGLLLFRLDGAEHADTAPRNPDLLAVLLVGETSTWGVHHLALERALQIADTITTDDDRRVRILGPTFSGSIPSLREELDHYACEHAMKHRGFDVVSGSATSPDNPRLMNARWPGLTCRPGQSPWLKPVIRYRATVTDDATTEQRFYHWLARTMDLTPDHCCTLGGVGILTETDTRYGRSFAKRIAGCPGGPGPESQTEYDCTDLSAPPVLRPGLVVRYPARIAHLRSIYERNRKRNLPAERLPIEDPHRMLDLSLGDSDEPVEAVPAFSDKTQFADELVLTSSLQAMCRSNLRFLGIIGTDIIDRLFLAREAHRYCPNVRLFTFETDVLFAHPDVRDEMNGSLIVSPYPLFPQNGVWTPQLARGVIAPFGDSTSHGVYNAMLLLLGRPLEELAETVPPSHGKPAPVMDKAMAVWVSATGNGMLWPVQSLDDEDVRPPDAHAGDAASVRELKVAERRGEFMVPRQWKWAFRALWLACSAVAAGYWLGRCRRRWRLAGIGAFHVFEPIKGKAVERAVFSLLALVPVTCAYTASMGLKIAEYLLVQPHPSRFVTGSLLHALLVACGSSLLPVVATWLALSAACADVVIAPAVEALAARRSAGPSHKRLLYLAAWGSAAILVVAALALTGGIVFKPQTWITLRERAINVSSGLSPLLPTCAFGAAAFFAARLQLARLHGWGATFVDDPMVQYGHPAAAGMAALRDRTLAALRDFGGGRRLGAALAVVVVAGWLLGAIPRGMTMLEGPVWTWPLALAVLAATTLAVAAYVPFALGCHRLRGYLRRHANLPTASAFSRLPGRAADKMSAIFVQPPPTEEMQRALHQLRLLGSLYPATKLQLGDGLRAELEGAIHAASRLQDALHDALASAAGPDVRHREAHQRLHRDAEQELGRAAATLARVLAAQWERTASSAELAVTTENLRKFASDHAPDHATDPPTAELYQRAAADETQVWLRLAEEFVVTQSATLFHQVLHVLRRLLTTATVAMLLVLAGLSSYPFERRPMLQFIAQSIVIAMVVGTIAILAGMENSEVLARIRKTEPGKVTWNRSFIARVAIYGLLPILSVVATQLPSVGGVLFGWLPALFGLLQ